MVILLCWTTFPKWSLFNVFNFNNHEEIFFLFFYWVSPWCHRFCPTSTDHWFLLHSVASRASVGWSNERENWEKKICCRRLDLLIMEIKPQDHCTPLFYIVITKNRNCNFSHVQMVPLRLEIWSSQLHPVRALAYGTLNCNCLDVLLSFVNFGVYAVFKWELYSRGLQWSPKDWTYATRLGLLWNHLTYLANWKKHFQKKVNGLQPST